MKTNHFRSGNSLSRRRFLGVAAGALSGVTAVAHSQESNPGTQAKPAIHKIGTIDLDVVETTPVVFRDRVYRFEYVRPGYWGNTSGDSYFHFVDRETGEASTPFAKGYHLGCAMVEGGTMYVMGTNIWDGERVDLFVSTDMERWESWNVLNLPGYGIFNTSLCAIHDGYMLMYEVGKPPEAAGKRFTALFARSSDLRHWERMPPECTYSKDRYTAPHALRHHNDYYYNFFLEAVNGGYEQYLVRSKDLVDWELSPLNPVLKASDEDKQIANPKLTGEQRKVIADATNINNSDIDFCEHNGRLVINYSWGDQQGTEFLAEAEYDGPLGAFLQGWFPK